MFFKKEKDEEFEKYWRENKNGCGVPQQFKVPKMPSKEENERYKKRIEELSKQENGWNYEL